MAARLHRDRRQLREHLAAPVGGGGDVADRPRAGTARHAQVRLDGDPAAAALREVEGGRQRVGLHAGRPDQRLARQHLAAGEGHGVGGDGRDLGAEPHLDAAGAQRLEGVAAARRRERVQQVVLHLDQHDPGPADVEVRVVLAEHHGEQLGERAGGLDAGGAAADHDEGEPAAVDLRRIAVGRLEALEHVVPQPGGVGERVEREAVLGRARGAEPGDGGAGGQHEVVEREVGLARRRRRCGASSRRR